MNNTFDWTNFENWQEAVQSSTNQIWQYIIETHPGSTKQAVHDAVINSARDALNEMSNRVEASQLTGGIITNHAGLFRFVLEHYEAVWNNPISAESVMLIVQRTLEQIESTQGLVEPDCPSE